MAWEFAAAGYQVVADVCEADIYILNTCSVTANADVKARHRLRLAHSRNPRAFIAAVGCYAERGPNELSSIKGVGLVVSNRDKSSLLSILETRLGLTRKPCSTEIAQFPSMRTRAFIKVQDGCQGTCAYCIVPRVRAKQTSIPEPEVVSTVQHRFAHGVKEAVITGTEVGCYAAGGYGLRDLLEAILAETKMPRIRLSSLQPQEITTDLLSLWSNARMCPHFHVSVQSGSDSVLRLMRRRYSVSQYTEAISRIRAAVPDVAITTDVIVGFPGETDEMFEESLRFCRETHFARIHVFPFSPRPGTEAAAMPDAVDEQTKRRRTKLLLSLAKESASLFEARFRGRNLPVLWEQRGEDGAWSGLTDNYIPVTLRSTAEMSNTITQFTID